MSASSSANTRREAAGTGVARERRENGGGMGGEVVAPKLFVSYSWTSPDSQRHGFFNWPLWRTRDSGVDVILDKWDLKEGNDAYAFMERMVTDATIRKVVLVCDRVYARRPTAEVAV